MLFSFSFPPKNSTFGVLTGAGIEFIIKFQRLILLSLSLFLILSKFTTISPTIRKRKYAETPTKIM